MTRARQRLLAAVLAASLVALPGCLIGSPLAAISGEPYGMTIDDWAALQGRKGRIWSGAPFFAAIDLPFAAVLDTGFLPISLLIWGIRALAGGGEDDHDHHHGEGGHTHGEDGHTHGEDGHTHGEDGHSHGEDGHTH